jgi:hypothetical protein
MTGIVIYLLAVLIIIIIIICLEPGTLRSFWALRVQRNTFKKGFCHPITLVMGGYITSCTYPVLAGPLGCKFCNPHVAIFLSGKHHQPKEWV